MTAVVVGAAGGAELHDPIASLDAKAVGGFTLTSRILRINVFFPYRNTFCTVYRGSAAHFSID